MKSHITIFEDGFDITSLLGNTAKGIIESIFPNAFGGNRRLLTDADWNTLIPYNGYWHNKLREYLKSRIHYDVDAVRNVAPFTIYFAQINGFGNDEATANANFSKILSEERAGEKTGVPGFNYSNPLIGGTGFDLMPLLLIGGGILLIMTLSKKRK